MIKRVLKLIAVCLGGNHPMTNCGELLLQNIRMHYLFNYWAIPSLTMFVTCVKKILWMAPMVSEPDVTLICLTFYCIWIYARATHVIQRRLMVSCVTAYGWVCGRYSGTIFRSRLTQNAVDQATTHLRYHCILYAGKMHSESSAMLRDRAPIEEVCI